jgi:hypothetical protein
MLMHTPAYEVISVVSCDIKGGQDKNKVVVRQLFSGPLLRVLELLYWRYKALSNKGG